MASVNCFPVQLAVLCVCPANHTEGLDPSVYGSQPNPMGFHEGARRIVRCDGGHITGFYVYVSHLGGFSEPTANAIRVICSSSRIQLEFETGSFPDTMVFGNMPEASQPVKGDANVLQSGSSFRSLCSIACQYAVNAAEASPSICYPLLLCVPT